MIEEILINYNFRFRKIFIFVETIDYEPIYDRLPIINQNIQEKWKCNVRIFWYSR